MVCRNSGSLPSGIGDYLKIPQRPTEFYETDDQGNKQWQNKCQLKDAYAALSVRRGSNGVFIEAAIHSSLNLPTPPLMPEKSTSQKALTDLGLSPIVCYDTPF